MQAVHGANYEYQIRLNGDSQDETPRPRRGEFPQFSKLCRIKRAELRRWIKLKVGRRFRKALGVPQSAKIHRPKIKNSHSGNRQNRADATQFRSRFSSAKATHIKCML
jgi:hypothetical protein